MNPQTISAMFTGVGVIFSILMGIISLLHSRQASAKSEGQAQAKVEALGAAQSERMNALEGRLHIVESSIRALPELDKAIAVLAKDFDGFRKQIETKVDESNHNTRNIRAGQDHLSRLIQEVIASGAGKGGLSGR
ncbi:MAG: hypothetical protein WA840_19785 [Caulobacteraceae bacterium]